MANCKYYVSLGNMNFEVWTVEDPGEPARGENRAAPGPGVGPSLSIEQIWLDAHGDGTFNTLFTDFADDMGLLPQFIEAIEKQKDSGA